MREVERQPAKEREGAALVRDVPTSVGIAPAARRPSDRTYRRLHWTFMLVIAAVLLYGVLAIRFILLPRGLTARMAVVILLSFNVLWWTIADRRLARYVRSAWWSGVLRAVVLAFVVALTLPLISLVVTDSMPQVLVTGPTWYSAAVTLWALGLAVVMPIAALVRLVVLGVTYVVWHRQPAGAETSKMPGAGETGGVSAFVGRHGVRPLQSGSPAAESQGGFDPGRRVVLKTALAGGPMILLGAMTAESYRQEGKIEVHRHDIAAPWLPARLRGLTITQVSDIHLGRHYRPYMLPRMVELANGLGGDLVMVTGDVVDTSNDFLPPALDAIEQLEHRHGLFLCMGNHDEIDNRAEYVALVRKRLPLLINERRVLEIGGEKLTLAALDYAWGNEPTKRRAGHRANIAATFEAYDPDRDGPMLMLSHNPSAFDLLAQRGVPLTLSGHTHGGQLMISRPDERPDIGIGTLLFKYLRGFYQVGESTLFVNSGVGNWFPLRINAPAEVVQIRLV
jgi:uncharacterized protein